MVSASHWQVELSGEKAQVVCTHYLHTQSFSLLYIIEPVVNDVFSNFSHLTLEEVQGFVVTRESLAGP